MYGAGIPEIYQGGNKDYNYCNMGKALQVGHPELACPSSGQASSG